MIQRKINQFIKNRNCTLLGVGPMSRNCVDAVIELANDYDSLIMLIASRRQIDSDDFGGGYVNNWSTDRFAQYVIDNDKKGRVILARDHGGPWQNEKEKEDKLSLRQAMESAKNSFRVDIESGFDIIHIDPSIDIHGTPDVDEILQRIFELYEYCWSIAQSQQRKVLFEIGTEEQSGCTNDVDDLEYVLQEILRFCESSGLPRPSFIVSQTGTRVMETRNVGTFESPVRVPNQLPADIQVPRIIDICKKNDIWLKQHNTDYLSDEALAWHPKLGIHSANVAPEFGVAETRAFINILRQEGLDKQCDAFLELAYNSNKWKKWLIPGSEASDTDCAIMAGHYVFSDPRFSEIKRDAQSNLSMNLDEHLKKEIKASIFRYMQHFHLVRF